MNLLIIGYSKLFINRILPIIDELSYIESVSIAKFIEQEWNDAYKAIKKQVVLYDDFETAIDQFKGELAYISTTNHSHFTWAKKTLEKGIHTIVDKPATLKHQETEELITIAKKKNLLLSESIVYLYHPQMKLIKNFCDDKGLLPKLVTFLFSFPPLDKENFRYDKKLGGGAIMDTSPYLASIGRFFFEEVPLSCSVIINETTNSEVEISYSVLLKFSKGRSIVGHSSFTTEYINRINVLGTDLCLDVDRIFTLPEHIENNINIRSGNESHDIIAPKANMFKEYFLTVDQAIKNNQFQQFYRDMMMDSQTRELLIKSNGYGN
jgi:NDP-hexose-3-ketoreductase